MTEHEDWRGRAQCLDLDPNTMQPDVASPAEVEAAMRVCVGCPVLEQCDQLRASQREPYGVFAGKWWGDPPRNPDVTWCGWCGGSTGTAKRSYCSTRCQVAAWRARQAVSA